VRGEIVAQGNEVDLYNEDLCGLAFPKGVGRYRWTLAGEMLHLDLIGKDPRAPVSSTTRRIAGSG
jgi:hypothetical protein